MIAGKKVNLREKRSADAKDDHIWQTDPELTRLDAAEMLTVGFREYLSEYAREIRCPSSERHMLAIDTLDGDHIGNCIYYSVNESDGEAELGIMIGERGYWDTGYGADAVATMLNYIFREISLRRIYLKTMVSNGRAQKCFQKCGFTPHGRTTRNGHGFILMEISRKLWEERHLERI